MLSEQGCVWVGDWKWVEAEVEAYELAYQDICGVPIEPSLTP